MGQKFRSNQEVSDRILYVANAVLEDPNSTISQQSELERTQETNL